SDGAASLCQLEVGYSAIKNKSRKQTAGKKTHFDMQLGQTLIQAKFNYDFDVLWLEKERTSAGGKLVDMWRQLENDDVSYGWSVSYPVISDIFDSEKRPDVFIWIIACRNLGSLSTVDLNWDDLIKFVDGSRKLNVVDWTSHINQVRD